MPMRKLLMIIILLAAVSPRPAAANAPVVLEDLNYQISLGPWDNVAQVHLSLKEVGPGRYQAEFSGAAQGMWKLLSRWLPERYQTEMAYREGRLQPLVYREEFMNHGRRVVKEYRFDYDRGRVSLWRRAGNGPQEKKWEVPLKGQVYDLLSLFYNVRLGAMGPIKGGANFRVAALPTPKPQELIFRIGATTDKGRKVMLDFRQPESGQVDQYFIYLSPDRVPTLAWTRVLLFGKLAGRLLNPGGIKKEMLPVLRPLAAVGR